MISIATAELIVLSMGSYLGIGLIFGLAFVLFFAGGIDPAAKGMTLRVRLIILPGVMLLWPVMLLKTLLRKGPPVQ